MNKLIKVVRYTNSSLINIVLDDYNIIQNKRFINVKFPMIRNK